MTRRPGHPARRGFTLVEVLAAIVVIATLGSVASTILFNAIEGYVNASTGAQLHAEVSIAMDRIVRECRNVDLDSSASDVAPDIDSLTATSMQWNTDGVLTLSGTQLLLTEPGGSSGILLTDVTALSISAFDEDGTAMAASLSGDACDDIRRIEVEITVTRRTISESLRTLVHLRSTLTGAGS